MNVNARNAVSIFCHNSWNKRYIQKIKFVGDPVYHNGKKSGIRENYLVLVECGRVAVKCCADVCVYIFPDLRNSSEKAYGKPLCFIGNIRFVPIFKFGFIAQNDRYLPYKIKQHVFQKHCRIISYGIDAICSVFEETRKYYISELIYNFDNNVLFRLIKSIDIVYISAGFIVGKDISGKLADFVFKLMHICYLSYYFNV